MRIRPFNRVSSFHGPAILIIILCFMVSSCTSLLNSAFKGALPPMEGTQIIPGLKDKVLVKRDNLGIPYIEASNIDDLIFTMGYDENGSDLLL